MLSRFKVRFRFVGEENVPSVPCFHDSNHYKFTGKERDGESGLDHFGARYYSNGMGRFISADWSLSPIPVPYADINDPESLNLYSYVRNVPASRTDPSGHCTSDGEKHGFWWCLGHAVGITETQKEFNARIETERLWLLKNARNSNKSALSQSQLNVLKGASAQQVDSLYKQYDAAIKEAQCGGFFGCETWQPASELQRAEDGSFVFRRIHSDETITRSNSGSYDYWKNKSSEEIIESLKAESRYGELTVKPDGAVMDGNTRLKILEERGVDLNKLERIILELPKEPLP